MHIFKNIKQIKHKLIFINFKSVFYTSVSRNRNNFDFVGLGITILGLGILGLIGFLVYFFTNRHDKLMKEKQQKEKLEKEKEEEKRQEREYKKKKQAKMEKRQNEKLEEEKNDKKNNIMNTLKDMIPPKKTEEQNVPSKHIPPTIQASQMQSIPQQTYGYQAPYTMPYQAQPMYYNSNPYAIPQQNMYQQPIYQQLPQQMQPIQQNIQQNVIKNEEKKILQPENDETRDTTESNQSFQLNNSSEDDFLSPIFKKNKLTSLNDVDKAKKEQLNKGVNAK